MADVQTLRQQLMRTTMERDELNAQLAQLDGGQGEQVLTNDAILAGVDLERAKGVAEEQCWQAAIKHVEGERDKIRSVVAFKTPRPIVPPLDFSSLAQPPVAQTDRFYASMSAVEQRLKKRTEDKLKETVLKGGVRKARSVKKKYQQEVLTPEQERVRCAFVFKDTKKRCKYLRDKDVLAAEHVKLCRGHWHQSMRDDPETKAERMGAVKEVKTRRLQAERDARYEEAEVHDEDELAALIADD